MAWKRLSLVISRQRRLGLREGGKDAFILFNGPDTRVNHLTKGNELWKEFSKNNDASGYKPTGEIPAESGLCTLCRADCNGQM